MEAWAEAPHLESASEQCEFMPRKSQKVGGRAWFRMCCFLPALIRTRRTGAGLKAALGGSGEGGGAFDSAASNVASGFTTTGFRTKVQLAAKQ